MIFLKKIFKFVFKFLRIVFLKFCKKFRNISLKSHKIHQQKREYKISNALRQKMDLEASSSDSSEYLVDEKCEKNGTPTSCKNSKYLKANSSSPTSIGIFMRSKFKNNLKNNSGKKFANSNISTI